MLRSDYLNNIPFPLESVFSIVSICLVLENLNRDSDSFLSGQTFESI